MRKFYLFVLIYLFSVKGLKAQTTYTWVGGATGDYQLSTNWSPVRAAAATDILQFNATSPIVVTNVANQTIGALKINSGTSSVSLAANTSNTLTLSSVTPLTYTTAGSILAADFLNLSISAAANFTVNLGTFGIVPGTGGKININGALVLTSPGILDIDVMGTGGFIINNGGSITYNSGTFNCVNGAAITWATGSNYFHAANGASASSIPVSTWQTGSTCNITGMNAGVIVPTGFTAATFANLNWNCAAQFAIINGLLTTGSILNITDTLKINNTNSKELRITNGKALINAKNYVQNSGIIALQAGSDTTSLYLSGNFTLNGGILYSLSSVATTTATAIFDFKGYVTRNGGSWDSQCGSSTSQVIVQFSSSLGQTVSASGNLWNPPSGGRWNVVNINTDIVSGVNLSSGNLRVNNNNSALAATLSMGGIFTGGGSIVYQSTGSGGTTLIYNGSFFQTATTIEFPTTGGGFFPPSNLTINNSLGVTFPNSFSRTIPGTLTMLNGNLALGSNVLSLTNVVLATQLSYTAGFITTGTLSRLYPNTGLPTSSGPNTLFPFGTGVNNRSLNIYFSSSNITSGGTISVSHTPTAGASPISPKIIDNGDSLDKKTNTKWTVSTGGGFILGATTASITAAAANIGSIDSILTLRLFDGTTPNLGTLIASTGTPSFPVVGKSALSSLNTDLYVGSDGTNVYNPLIIVTFIWTGASTIDGDWTRPTNWTGAVGYPSASTEIAIITNNSAPFQPFIKTGTGINVYRLTVGAGMSLTLQSSAGITVYDSLTFSGTAIFDPASTFGYASSNPPPYIQNILDLPYGDLNLSGTAYKSLAPFITVKGKYLLSGTAPTNTGNTFTYAGAGAQTITAASYNNLTIKGDRGGAIIALGALGPTQNMINIAGVFDVSLLMNDSVKAAFNTVKFMGTGPGSQVIPGFFYQAIDNGPGDRTFDNQGTFNSKNVIYCRSLTRNNTGIYTVANSKVNFYVSGTNNPTTYTGGTFHDVTYSGNMNGLIFEFDNNAFNIAGTFNFAITNFKPTVTKGNASFNFNGTGNQVIPAFRTNIATGTPAFKYDSLIIAGGNRKVTFAGSNTDTIGIKKAVRISSAFTGAGNGIITDSSTVSFSVGSGNIPILPAANGGVYSYNNLNVASGTRALAGNMNIGGNLSVVGVNDTTAAILNINDTSINRIVNVFGNMSVNGGGTGSVATGQIDLNTGSNRSTTLNLAGNLSISGNGQLWSTTTVGNSNGLIKFNGTSPQTYLNTSAYKNGMVNFTIGDAVLPSKLTLLNTLNLLSSTNAANKSTLTVASKSSLDCGTNNVITNGSGNSIFNLNANSELITANTGGVEGAATSTSTGSILNDVTLARTYDALASYNFNAAASTNMSFPTTPATFPMANLTLGDNSTAATFSLNFPIAISDSFKLRNSATMALGNFDVTLTSTAAKTARVSQLGTSAAVTYGTGRFNVERYYPSRRAWRLVTAPLFEGGSVFNTWQINGGNTSGRGTWVTGNPETNGIDASPEHNSSLKEGLGYTPVLNTNTTLISNNTGTGADNKVFFLFVRGDRIAANFSTSNSNVTTLNGRGKIQTGAQTFTAAATAGGYTMIGNPYASPVDFFKATRNNLLDRLYVWDPLLGAQGGYITLDGDNLGNYTPSVASPSGFSNLLQSSQAFIVQTTAAGPASLVFGESNKSIVNNSTSFFRPAKKSSFRIQLLQVEAGDKTTITDGLLAEFGNGFSNEIGNEDALKISNVNEMLAIQKGNTILSIERRPDFSANDTLFLSFKKAKQRNYRLEFAPANLSATASAFIDDSYTGKQTPLSLTSNTQYDFTVNGEAKSAAVNRFKIVFKEAGLAPLPVTLKSIKAYQQGSAINVDWTVENEISINKYEVEKSENGIDFTKVFSTPAKGFGSVSTTYNYIDAAVIKGNNFYRIAYYNQDGSFQYSRTVLVNIGKAAAGMSIYPNPVTGNSIGLTFNSLEKGIYSVRLVNASGQVLMVKQLNHTGGSSVETLTPGSRLTTGVYQMEVIDPAQKVTTIKVLVQ